MINTILHNTNEGLVIERKQDMDPILKQVREAKEVMSSKPVDGLGYFAGTIPGEVVEKYMNETGVSYQEIINTDIHVKRILNDPAYKKFRVWEGRV